MELILGYEILESYKRLPYKAWYAFAEFIDNSTQSYRNHHAEMDEWFEETGDTLTVNITYFNASKKVPGFIIIEDNAYGMNLSDLQNALTLGRKPDISNERSKYGLGLKTAAFWFGNVWTIETTQKGSKIVYSVTVNLHDILSKEKKYYADFKKNHPGKPVEQYRPELVITERPSDESKHGTTLTINELVRSINTQTANNCIEYLQSIYRVDLTNEILDVEFQGTSLYWSQADIDRKLDVGSDGKPLKRILDFEINGKSVSGWAGVLASGGKKSGGFSLIQADRVIVGYPKNYKNSLIFGPEDGGRNDLTNQRLTGELILDEKFAVSHTKDQILFVDDEEDELDKALFEHLQDYKKHSNIPHKARGRQETDKDFDFESAIKAVIENINTQPFQDVILNKTILPVEAIVKTNDETIERLLKTKHSLFTYYLDAIAIRVILSENSSPYDPYLIVRPLGGEKRIDVVINENHPYWMELADNKSRFSFLLSCIYDGVAEWKAGFMLNRLDPDTIKMVKDTLLRLQLLVS